jgi:DNA polymerase
MKQTELNKIYEECKNCTACPLHESRTNIVFGKGNPNAKMLFIGEAPGQHEDEQGLPFVGVSGKLLDKYLDAIGLSMEDAYIANILKCRPPNNRDPKEDEEQACIGYLRRQLAVIEPKTIVCLGRISAFKIIKPDFKITQEHGKWFKKGDYLMTAVYHPSALLRDPRKRDDMMADFIAIKEKLKELDGE